MKISKDSWHYKFLTKDFWFVDGAWDVSNSLCGYFWQVIFKGVEHIIKNFILPAVVVGVTAIAPLFQLVMWAVTGYWNPDTFGAFMVVVEVFLALILSTIFGGFWLYEKIKYSEVEMPEKVNIFTEYVKAKHEKVCPVLEFTDGE